MIYQIKSSSSVITSLSQVNYHMEQMLLEGKVVLTQRTLEAWNLKLCDSPWIGMSERKRPFDVMESMPSTTGDPINKRELDSGQWIICPFIWIPSYHPPHHRHYVIIPMIMWSSIHHPSQHMSVKSIESIIECHASIPSHDIMLMWQGIIIIDIRMSIISDGMNKKIIVSQ